MSPPKKSLDLGEAVYVQEVKSAYQITLVDYALDILKLSQGDNVTLYAGPIERSVVIMPASLTRKDLTPLYVHTIKKNAQITVVKAARKVLKVGMGDYVVMYEGPWKRSIVLMPSETVQEPGNPLYVQNVKANAIITIPRRARDILHVDAGDRVIMYEGPVEGSVIIMSTKHKIK